MLLTMTEKTRIEAVQAVMDRRLTAAQAAHGLNLSERLHRALATAKERGRAGLVPGNRGRAPWNKTGGRKRTILLALDWTAWQTASLSWWPAACVGASAVSRRFGLRKATASALAPSPDPRQTYKRSEIQWQAKNITPILRLYLTGLVLCNFSS
jgi:hypothetical protein